METGGLCKEMDWWDCEVCIVRGCGKGFFAGILRYLTGGSYLPSSYNHVVKEGLAL